MSYHPDDTICAIATAPGGSARGMIRVSGTSALPVVSQLFCTAGVQRLESLRQATAISGHVRIACDAPPRRLPCELFVWPDHRSYTREPVAELHTLGSPPLLASLLAAVCAAGARPAEPGEFTLRAFLAGRIDLTQAEAVLGVVDAQGGNDLTIALAQMAGGLARPLHRLRDDLLQLLAELEAGLDFVEEDINFVSPQEIARRLGSTAQLLAEVAEQMESRHTAAHLRQIVLVGRPNAGKSSLFNALASRRGIPSETPASHAAAALVSPQRGTTRDYLTATISLDGVRCQLVDTAGIDETRDEQACRASAGMESNRADSLEQIADAAQRQAKARWAQAALRAYCIEAPEIVERDALAAAAETAGSDVLVVTKCDLVRQRNWFAGVPSSIPVVVTSSLQGEGLDDLCETFRAVLVSEQATQRGQAVAATAGRCRESIRLARAAITQAGEIASANGGNELVAVELRAALHELGKVVGAVYTDDLLDRIFSTFCVGK
jgi:tRNA modification GTPase